MRYIRFFGPELCYLELMIFFKKTMAPYFLLAAVVAILCPMYLVGILINGYEFNSTLLTPLQWHAHEMLFTFVTLVLSGFLLTAAQNWTGRQTISFKESIILFSVFVIGRIYIVLGSSNVITYLLCIAPLFWLIIRMIKVLKGNRNFYILNHL